MIEFFLVCGLTLLLTLPYLWPFGEVALHIYREVKTREKENELDLSLSREWYERMIDLENDADICAGRPDDPRDPPLPIIRL